MDILKTEIELRSVNLDQSCRLFHGRGQCFTGFEDILIDWFEPVVLVTLYCRRSSLWLEELTSLLQKQIPDLEAIVLQQRYLKNSPSQLLYGRLPAELVAVESGLKYQLSLNSAQNIGFFPDMAIARDYVRSHAKGNKVLNLFAYTCSFSVAAVAGNANQVVNLDMSRNSLISGKLNHQLNMLDQRNVSYLSVELFRSFSKLKKLSPFNLIICDPPGDQGQSFRAERDWPRLVRKLPSLLAPGGIMMACASSPHLSSEYLQDLFSHECPQAHLKQILTAGENFPERDIDKGCRVLIYQLGNSPNKS
jgi:23S rRNA (cytosine1962-C5)-methyltransferase